MSEDTKLLSKLIDKIDRLEQDNKALKEQIVELSKAPPIMSKDELKAVALSAISGKEVELDSKAQTAVEKAIDALIMYGKVKGI